MTNTEIHVVKSVMTIISQIQSNFVIIMIFHTDYHLHQSYQLDIDQHDGPTFLIWNLSHFSFLIIFH